MWHLADELGDGDRQTSEEEFYGADSPFRIFIDTNDDGDYDVAELMRFLPGSVDMDAIGVIDKLGAWFPDRAHGCVLTDQCDPTIRGLGASVDRQWFHNTFRPLYSEAAVAAAWEPPDRDSGSRSRKKVVARAIGL